MIGDTNSIFIIAEAGVNHNGDPDMAIQLIDAAAAAGADAVKFQTFHAEDVITDAAPKAAYQIETVGKVGSQLDMARTLELSKDHFKRLKSHARRKNIIFFSTPFDLGSLHFLADDLKVPLLKIPSGEITNGPLLLAAAKTGLNMLLSTGMSTLNDIEAALGVLAFGYSGSDDPPSLDGFTEALNLEDNKATLNRNVTLLHCTTQYPAPFEDLNLRAINTLRDQFGLRVGYSDHSPGIEAAVAAVALGARVIEKHFTLDQSLPGPDHMASLEPDELQKLATAIRNTELALGDGVKQPKSSEIGNMVVARKSLIARTPILAGEPFSEENLTVKRPGSGISPMHYWEYLGGRAKKNYGYDDVI
jgi:N-acetylneuraminate synthase